jgi:hypothetical protein
VKGTLGKLFCEFYYWRNFLRWVKLVVSSKKAFGQDCFMHEFVPCKVWNIAPYFKINFLRIISIDMIKFCRHDFMHMITNLCTRWFKLAQFLIIKVIFSIYASMFTWIPCFSNTSRGTCGNFCRSTSPAKFDRHVEDVTSDMPWTTICTDIVAILYLCSIMKQPILVLKILVVLRSIIRLLVGSCVSRNHKRHWQKSMKRNDYLERQTSRYN